ncbi:MAG: hypothetical protein FH749_13230 [Firmicutes bacterium]|nr:hypothetical protein [Bacillota bacterium]
MANKLGLIAGVGLILSLATGASFAMQHPGDHNPQANMSGHHNSMHDDMITDGMHQHHMGHMTGDECYEPDHHLGQEHNEFMDECAAGLHADRH